MFERILVPYDGSRGGESAVVKAIDLARLCDASVTILTVYRHHGMLEASLSMVRPAEPGIMDDVLRRHASEMAEDAKRKALEAGLSTVRAFVKAGHPSRTITAFAKANNHDLIVMGTRGLGSVESYLLGSVSLKVSATAACPVLLV